jgi:uncharacterized protein (UPF0548 family)
MEQIKEPKGYPVFPNMTQALQWAKQNRESVRVQYRCESGRVIIRDIEPHGDFWAKTTGNRILVVFDETVNDIRGFILGNVEQYKFKGEKFTPKFSFSPARKGYKDRRHEHLKRRRIF